MGFYGRVAVMNRNPGALLTLATPGYVNFQHDHVFVYRKCSEKCTPAAMEYRRRFASGSLGVYILIEYIAWQLERIRWIRVVHFVANRNNNLHLEGPDSDTFC